MPPTLREIAQAAGVSKMTVSLALRGVPRIPAATRERIRQAASALGYQPDATFNRLMAHIRAKAPAKYAATLAVASFQAAGLLRLEPGGESLGGIEEQAARRGYGVDYIGLLEGRNTPARVLRILQVRGIQGIILHSFPSPFLPPAFRDLYENFPCVVIGMKPRLPALHFVAEDAYAAVRLAFGQALKAGYRRPRILLNNFYARLQERRLLASFLAEQLVLPPEDRLPFLDFSGPGHWASQFAAWHAEHRPDCIIAGLEARASLLQPAGIQVPRDLGYIALQREPGLPDTARIDANHARLGAAAVDLLVGLLHAGETGVPAVQCSTLIEGTWVPGATLPARHAGSTDGVPPHRPPADPRVAGKTRTDGGVPVDLRAVVNRPLASFAGYEAPLLCLEPGHQKIHGVRFEILDESATGTAALAMNGCRHSHPGLAAAAAIRLRLERHAARVCFLHSCVHAREHGVIAYYHFGYEDGSRAAAEVIAHGIGPAAERRAKASNVQDWWPDYVQFENDQTRQVVIASPDEPDLYKRFLYLFQWRNPHPERLIRTLRIVAAPDSPATLIVLAITTVRDPAAAG